MTDDMDARARVKRLEAENARLRELVGDTSEFLHDMPSDGDAELDGLQRRCREAFAAPPPERKKDTVWEWIMDLANRYDAYVGDPLIRELRGIGLSVRRMEESQPPEGSAMLEQVRQLSKQLEELRGDMNCWAYDIEKGSADGRHWRDTALHRAKRLIDQVNDLKSHVRTILAATPEGSSVSATEQVRREINAGYRDYALDKHENKQAALAALRWVDEYSREPEGSSVSSGEDGGALANLRTLMGEALRGVTTEAGRSKVLKCEKNVRLHLTASGVPYGYKLVPVKPTNKMGAEGWRVLDSDSLPLQTLPLPPDLPHQVYQAMIESAPEAGREHQEDSEPSQDEAPEAGTPEFYLDYILETCSQGCPVPPDVIDAVKAARHTLRYRQRVPSHIKGQLFLLGAEAALSKPPCPGNEMKPNEARHWVDFLDDRLGAMSQKIDDIARAEGSGELSQNEADRHQTPPSYGYPQA